MLKLKKSSIMIIILLFSSVLISCTNEEEKEVFNNTKENDNSEMYQEENDGEDTNEENTEKMDDGFEQLNGNKLDYETPDSIHVLVNKSNALPADYTPDDLVVPDVRFPFTEDDPKKQLREEAAKSLEEMFAAAESEGHYLFALSGYRSYDRQEVIFAANVDRHGENHANTYSARAGESEHQTGLVMDITSEAVKFDLVTEFGDTPEGQWVSEHAHEYGFIIRYEKGKEHITKYQYEPWHLRYIGIDAAKAVYESNLSFEEFLGEY